MGYLGKGVAAKPEEYAKYSNMYTIKATISCINLCFVAAPFLIPQTEAITIINMPYVFPLKNSVQFR